MAMDVASESPPQPANSRQSILGSFLRGRPRGTSTSHPPPTATITSINDDHPPLPSRNSPSPSPPNDSHSNHRRRPATAISPNLQPSHSTAGGLSAANLTAGAFSQMLRRRRSAGALANTNTPQTPHVVPVARTTTGNFNPTSSTHQPHPAATSTSNLAATNNPNPTSNPNIAIHNPSAGTSANPTGPSHRIRLVPHLDSRRSLKFDPICRDIREGDAPLRIGRFTDRSGMGLAAANASNSNKLAFKSKVVSRAHAEIWVESGGRFFIRDTKSSSGTFLNHVRLSPANAESRPSELKDGDMLQLGVDYQGGAEDIYKCVKIRVEVNREWQAQTNPFNANALKQLKAIAGPVVTAAKKPASAKTALPDCCICLFAVIINQALFIAPCSHAFHYKCIRPLLDQHHPAFSCPLCRTFANLDEDVEVEIENDDMLAEASAVIASVTNHQHLTAEAANPTSNSSRERVDRDRDPGAETEVEDGPRSILRNRLAPPLPANPFRREEVPELVEDVDQEMEVEMPLPPLPEGVNVDEVDSAEGESFESRRMHLAPIRDMSWSPGLVGSSARRVSGAILSEGDVDANADMETGGISDTSGRASGDGTMNGKRKR